MESEVDWGAELQVNIIFIAEFCRPLYSSFLSSLRNRETNGKMKKKSVCPNEAWRSGCNVLLDFDQSGHLLFRDLQGARQQELFIVFFLNLMAHFKEEVLMFYFPQFALWICLNAV